MALGHRTYLRVVAPVPSSSPAVREKSRYAQGVSIARVRSDLLEVPTGSLPVILVFRTDERAVNRKIEARFLSWPITSCLPVIQARRREVCFLLTSKRINSPVQA